MSTTPPVPMFAPDGTFHMVPNHLADQASTQGGGQPAVRIVDPSGTERWAPKDKVPGLLKLGAKLAPPAAGQTTTEIAQGISGIHPWKNPAAQVAAGLGRSAEGIVTAPYQVAKAAFAPPTSPEEVAASAGGPVSLATDRMVVQPAEKAASLAKQYWTSGHPILAGLSALGAIPVIGPMGQSAGERMAAGDIPGAVTESAANAFMMGAPKTVGAGVKGAADSVVPKVIPVSAFSRAVRSTFGAGDTDLAAAVRDTADEAKKGYDKAQAANKKATEDTLEARGKTKAQRVKAASENKQAAQEHAAKTAETKAANDAALREQGKIEPTQQKLQTASEELRARIETAREKALKVGNEKYSTVNEKLNHIPADNEAVNNALEESAEKIKGSQIRGSEAKPRILDDIEARIQKGDSFTYEDLQGYYSELNRELSKGSLPGDVYAAYDTLHDAVGNEMQRIADSQGAGAELRDARNYWRRMKQTFGKPYNPTDAATGTMERSSPEFARQEEQANRLRLLGSFDPEIPKVDQGIQNLRKGVKALGEARPVREVVKPLPAVPEAEPLPKYGEPKGSTPYERPTVNVQDVLRKNVAKRMEGWKSLNKYQVAHLASGAIGMVVEALMGHASYELPTAIYGAAPLTPLALARLSEIPAVREWLTRPQPGQLEMLSKIPNADRVRIVGALRGAVDAAARAGKPIPVAPVVAAVLAGQARPQHPALSQQSPVK